MTEHVSTSRMRRFCVRALPVSELTSIAGHLDVCTSCNEQFTGMLRSQRGSQPLKITLAPEFCFRHDHVDYEQLVGLADNALDVADREIIDIHLKACASCQEDLRSFLVFREQIDKETEPAFPAIAEEPTRKKPLWFAWWRGLAWNPAYAAAAVLIGIALVIGVALFLKRRNANIEAKQTQPPHTNIGAQTPTPANEAVTNVPPTPAPVPPEQLPRPASSPPLTVKNQEPIKKPQNAGAIVALNDGRRTVTINKAGDVSGLENMPTETRREVADVLVAENIEQPEIAKELSPTNITLRGPSAGQPFKLLSPGRTVIVTDQPSFEWEKLAGATGYRVLVGDLKGHEVAKSQELSPDRTRWTPPRPLKRGETYAWNVIAIVDGKEVSSPGASASEMKFKVLSASSAHELRQLEGSHLALGIFYSREGMIAEAEREFQTLVRENPQAPVLKKLLKQIQSWHTK